MKEFLTKYIEKLNSQRLYCQKLYEDYEKSSYTKDEKERVFIYLKNKIQIINELIFDAKNEIRREELKEVRK